MFTEIETNFSAKIGSSNVFSAQNQVVFKKKGLHQNWDWFFGQIRKSKRLRGAVFLWGAIFNFSLKIGLKSTKNVRFCILLEPPRPPLPGYATALIPFTGETDCCVLLVLVFNVLILFESTMIFALTLRSQALFETMISTTNVSKISTFISRQQADYLAHIIWCKCNIFKRLTFDSTHLIKRGHFLNRVWQITSTLMKIASSKRRWTGIFELIVSLFSRTLVAGSENMRRDVKFNFIL